MDLLNGNFKFLTKNINGTRGMECQLIELRDGLKNTLFEFLRIFKLFLLTIFRLMELDGGILI